jgi:membrane protease YdiL (CAAX protease family)
MKPTGSRRLGVPTLVGLSGALLGPGLVAESFKRIFGPRPGWPVNVLGLLTLWSLLALLVVLCIRWEGEPLASMGLKAPRGGSLLWAAGLIAVLELAVTPLVLRLPAVLHLNSVDRGYGVVLAWPLPLRIAAVITAGVVEETLYHGYAIERLASLTRSRWLAALLDSVLFALAHAPFWGAGLAVITFVTGGTLAAFYAWKRDLPACMIAHAVCDSVGFVFLPLVQGR